MRKIWQFLKEKDNRDVLGWICGGAIGVATVSTTISSYVLPTEVESVQADTATTKARKHLATSCKSINDIQAKAGGMIIPESAARKLELLELVGLSACQKWVARNELYARKGRLFKSKLLHQHFSRQNWYNGRFVEVTLDPIEEYNRKLIELSEN